MRAKELLLKQARISIVPESWNLMPVGTACVIRNDLRKPISVGERKKIRGQYPYYGPTGILGYIDEYLVEGTFALIGEDGDHFLKPEQKIQTLLAVGKFNVNNHAHLIESTEYCLAEWFSIYFRHRNITDFLSRQGANRYKLNKATLEKLPILLPPLPEQKAIAEVLSVWDRAIEKTDRLIQAKEKRFAWLLKILINQGSVKGEWRKVKLGELFGKELVVEKGTPLIKENTQAGNIPVVAGGQTYAYYHSEATHTRSCITISASGAYAGFVWLHDYPIWASDCNVIYAKTGSTQFFYYVLKSMQHRIFALQAGGAQPHVYAKDLKNLIIPVPTPEEQKRISETLNLAQREIELLKKLAEKQKLQKRGLMQKLLTGTWRVKMEEPS
jgi:type I restriction enzyme S subunit